MGSSLNCWLISWLAVCAFLSGACASGSSSSRAAPAASAASGLVAGPPPSVATGVTLTLVGARCAAGKCRCRVPGRDDAETVGPPEGSKRLEIRMSADGGTASLDLGHLGHVATTGPSSSEEDLHVKETCAYIDVPAGSTHDALFVAREAQGPSAVPGQGVAPRLSIAEYGPKGPYWYDVVAVTCDGPGGRCDRAAAASWGAAARQRKRGRIDPCGSAVVTKLAWETSGGQRERDGGLFRDFTVRFTMELKRFATQFPPGATECLPK